MGFVDDSGGVGTCAVDAGSTCRPEGDVIVEVEGIGRRLSGRRDAIVAALGVARGAKMIWREGRTWFCCSFHNLKKRRRRPRALRLFLRFR